MTPMVDEAGNVWEVDETGNPVRMITPAAAPQGRVFTLPMSAKDQAQNARQAAADARAEEDQRLQREAAERERLKFAATTNPDGSPKLPPKTSKQLPQNAAESLEKAVEAFGSLNRALNGFQDDYAGNTLTGGLENTAQRLLGTGTPGQAQWWADFAATDNILRNALFGASLTAGEKAAYEATSIKPNMDPAQVRANLTRRMELARGKLTRRTAYLKANGYDPDAVDALVGTEEGLVTPPATDQKADNELPGVANGADTKPPSPGEIKAVNGDTKSTYDPQVSALLDSMINAGAGEATINAALAKRGFEPVRSDELKAAQAWMKSNPGKTYYGGNATRTEDLSLGQKAVSALGPLGAGLASYFNAATAGLPQALAGEEGKGNLKAAEALSPNATLAGNVLGGVTGALGAEAAVAARAPAALARYAPRIADALYGGALGFNTAKDGEGLVGAAKGAGAGALGGFLGDRALRAVGAGVRGVTNPAVGYLQGRGIPLTAGQVLGGGVKKVEDALTSLPFVGNMVDARRMEGLREFNRAAFDNAAVNATGGTITDTGAAGLQQLRTLVGQRYDDALGGVQIDASTGSLPQSLVDLDAAAGRIPNVNGARDAAQASIDNRIGGAIDPDTYLMDGRGFQEAYRGLARTARERANGDYGHEIGQVMRQGQDALAGALDEQNPGAFAAFREANATNRNANVLAEALNKAKNAEDELFTPAQLNMADSQSARRLTGPLASAAGDRPFYDLANAGQAVLPSKLPDSGTWTRALVGGGATGVLGGGGYAAGGAEGAGAGTATGLGLTLALAAGGSRPAQRAIVSALTARPEAFRVAGDRLIANSGIGGWTGAGALAPLFIGN